MRRSRPWASNLGPLPPRNRMHSKKPGQHASSDLQVAAGESIIGLPSQGNCPMFGVCGQPARVNPPFSTPPPPRGYEPNSVGWLKGGGHEWGFKSQRIVGENLTPGNDPNPPAANCRKLFKKRCFLDAYKKLRKNHLGVLWWWLFRGFHCSSPAGPQSSAHTSGRPTPLTPNRVGASPLPGWAAAGGVSAGLCRKACWGGGVSPQPPVGVRGFPASPGGRCRATPARPACWGLPAA